MFKFPDIYLIKVIFYNLQYLSLSFIKKLLNMFNKKIYQFI